MPTRVHGTLRDEDLADTYSIWRKPGKYGYHLIVEGPGALDLSIEALQPTEEVQGGTVGSWKIIEERRDVRGGARLGGAVSVAPAHLQSHLGAEWIELRVRVSRAGGTGAVAYDLELDADGGGLRPQVEASG
ncbi:MAG TPA: hypothetical protein VF363_05560 [Candidatus Eisenbacteria bacterium]